MELLTLIRAQWDRTLAVAAVALGLLVLLLGWMGVSGAEAVVKQLPYVMSGGITGIVLVAIGAVLWVSADLRDQWRELRLVRVSLQEIAGLGAVRPLGTAPAAPNTTRPASAAGSSDHAEEDEVEMSAPSLVRVSRVARKPRPASGTAARSKA